MKRLLLITLLLSVFGCGRSVTDTSASGVRIIGATLSPSQKQAVEAGLHDVFHKARCRGYTKNLSPGDYTIRFEQGGIDSAGNPALKIPCGDYCGTTWDQGGYILVAGMVKNGEIVLPIHTDADLENLSRITGYEAEHLILKANDTREYERTKIHGYGTGHPLLADCR